MNTNALPHRLHLKHAALLFFLCVLTFSNGLFGDFMMDDHGLLLRETRMHNKDFMYQQFIPDARKVLKVEGSKREVYYRPLAHIIPMVCYLWFGKQPFYYHLFNLFLFYAACLTVYRLILVLKQDAALAFLTSAFFTVHPINGLLVNYITASVYSMQVLSMSLSLTTFLMALEGGKKIFRYLSSLFWLVMALFCHETSIAFPLYLAASLFFIKKFDFKKTLRYCLPFVLFIMAYVVFRMSHASLKIGVFDKPAYFDMSILNYLATFSRLVFWYLQKLLLGSEVVIIWVTPVIKERLLLWILGLAALGVLYLAGLVTFKRDVRSLGLTWLAIGFLPVTVGCFFQPESGIMLEPHWLVFASIGFFLFLAKILLNLQERVNKKFWLVALFLLVAFMASSRTHNEIWRDEKTYTRYWLKEVPGYKHVMFYLADIYRKEGKFAPARELLHRALAQRTTDYQIYNNLGLMDLSEGRLNEAISNFQVAERFDPRSSIVYTNLGIAYLQMKDADKAQDNFLKAISLDPYQIEAKLNLGDLYELQGNHIQAGQLFEESLLLDPADERILFALAKHDWLMGEKTKAIDVSKRFLKSSRDSQRLTTLGSLAAQNGYVDMAFALFNRAIALDRQFPDAYLELGKVYGNLNQFQRAIAMWQEGLKVAPEDNRFRQLILKAKEFLDQSVK